MNLIPRGKYEKVDSGFDIVPIVKPILKRWYLYVLMGTVGFFVGRYLVHNAKPKFQVDAALKVNRSFDFPTYGNEQTITGLRIFSKICNIYNYIGRVNTRDVLNEAYRAENLEVPLYKKGKLIQKDRPFWISYRDDNVVPLQASFHITPLDSESFHLKFSGGQLPSYLHQEHLETGSVNWPDIDSVFRFGAPINLHKNELVISRVEDLPLDTLSFEFEHLSMVMANYQQRLRIKTLNKGASAITIGITTDLKYKDQLFISAIMDVFANRDVDIKKSLAANTLHFLESEQAEIQDSLLAHTAKLQAVKEDGKWMNFDAYLQQLLSESDEIADERARIKMQKRYYQFLIQALANRSGMDTVIAPVMHSEQDAFLVDLVSDYRKAQLELEEIKYYAGPKNPSLLIKKQEIEWIESSILEGLNNLMVKLDVEDEQLSHRDSKNNFKISELPEHERRWLNSSRAMAFDEAQMKYLQKKSAAAGLAYHTLLPDVEIMQHPRIKGNKAVTPLNGVAYAFMVIIFLCIPFLIQQVVLGSKQTIFTENRILKGTYLPIIGLIPRVATPGWIGRKMGKKTRDHDFQHALTGMLHQQNRLHPLPRRILLSGSNSKVESTDLLEKLTECWKDTGVLILNFIPEPSNEDHLLIENLDLKQGFPHPSPYDPIINISCVSIFDNELLMDSFKKQLAALEDLPFHVLALGPDLQCPIQIEPMLSKFDDHWIVVAEAKSALKDLINHRESNKINTSVIYMESTDILPWFLISKKARERRVQWKLPNFISKFFKRRAYRTERV